jgi:aconitate hydratase
VPLVVLAGAEYGTGSSRDWAAKGTFLLGVRAVIATSFERIHRSNLVGMGVLPLELPTGTTWQTLGLTGEEIFEFPELNDSLKPRQMMNVVAKKPLAAGGGEGGDAPMATVTFPVTVRIDTPVELEYYRNGGILQTVLRKLLRS